MHVVEVFKSMPLVLAFVRISDARPAVDRKGCSRAVLCHVLEALLCHCKQTFGENGPVLPLCNSEDCCWCLLLEICVIPSCTLFLVLACSQPFTAWLEPNVAWCSTPIRSRASVAACRIDVPLVL